MGTQSAKPRLVVIGNGMTATRAVEELLARASDSYRIAMFGAEPGGCYSRIALSSVLADESALADVVTHPLGWYAQRDIALHAGDPVIEIDVARRCVRSAAGVEASFDELLICTGATPNLPLIPGATLPGVTTLRTIVDTANILAVARPGVRAVVVGGGVLGVEAAAGLARRGMTVTLVHQHGAVMERQLDAEAATLLQRHLLARGVQTVLQGRAAVIAGETHATAVLLADGRTLPADLVVFAVGITPNIELARAGGVACARGITVDDALRTSAPRVSALGECAEHRGVCYGLVAPLWAQAAIWARHITGDRAAAYVPQLSTTRLKLAGATVFSVGDCVGNTSSDALVYRDQRRGIYKRLLLSGSQLIGAVLYGDASDAAWYVELIERGDDVSLMRGALLHGRAACEIAAA